MDYIGLDVHKDSCVQTTVDEEGKIKYQGAFLNDKEHIEVFAEIVGDGKVVLESSTFSLPIYYLLKEKQIDVKLAHPKKIRWIAETHIKTDASDSEKLARLLKADLIPLAYAPTPEARENRNLIRHRSSLVKMRTAIKNSIHAILAKEAIKYNKKRGRSDLFGKDGLSFLKKTELNQTSREQLNSDLILLEKLNEEIKKFQVKAEEKTTKNNYAKLLTTIPGIAELSALAIMSEIDDPKRFPSHEKLASYFGIVPTLHQSGNTSRSGHIHRQGSSLLRSILVQDANAAIKTSKKVRKFYIKIKRKKGHKTAIVAVARKLVKYIFWVLTNEKEFVYEKR